MTIHPFAATSGETRNVTFNLVGADEMATSAQVALPGEQFPHELVLPASTLDKMLGGTLTPGVLMKLDLQGHEIEAMRGATSVLKLTEAIICEVSFYPVNDSGRPIFFDVLSFISKQGFLLYDFASLNGRYKDNRLQWGDILLVKENSDLLKNNAWRTI
jgi:hypothetical protein